jgi:hypothetical protein
MFSANITCDIPAYEFAFPWLSFQYGKDPYNDAKSAGVAAILVG